jgi:hypothetical protein
LRFAFALARALGMTVEDLFGTENTAAPVAARNVAPLGDAGARVTLAAMGDGYVALPLQGVTVSRAGFLPAGGLVAETDYTRGRVNRTVRPIGPPRSALGAAGCDPALPLLEAPLGLLDPPVAFSWWPCPSREALRLAAGGLVHVAGTHLYGTDSEYNIGPAAELLPGAVRSSGSAPGGKAWCCGPSWPTASPESGISLSAGCGWRTGNQAPKRAACSTVS